MLLEVDVTPVGKVLSTLTPSILLAALVVSASELQTSVKAPANAGERSVYFEPTNVYSFIFFCLFLLGVVGDRSLSQQLWAHPGQWPDGHRADI